MPFKDYAEFAEPPLELPYRGKTYTIPPVSIDAGRDLALIAEKDPEYTGKSSRWLWQRVLGAAYDEMLADGVEDKFLVRAGVTALTDHQFGRELAEVAWEKGADPKAFEAYLSSRADSLPSTSTGAGSSTPRRASGTGTRSRPSRAKGSAGRQ